MADLKQDIPADLPESAPRERESREQAAFAATELEPMYAAAAKERQGQRTDLKPDIVADLPQSSPDERKSREQAAKAVGASGRAVSQAKAVKRDAPETPDGWGSTPAPFKARHPRHYSQYPPERG